MEALGWPLRYTVADLTVTRLVAGINTALTQASHDMAHTVANQAEKELQALRDVYISSLKKDLNL